MPAYLAIYSLTRFSLGISAGRKQRINKALPRLGLTFRNQIGRGMASRRGSQTFTICLVFLLSYHMPGHIESMFDDRECASDASSVLGRTSKNEAGWMARFA